MSRPTKGKSIRVAMCQIFCLSGDRSGNFIRIENALQDAARAGAQIACFPETSILGWVYSDAHQRAYPIPGQDSDRLCALAKQYKLYICIGLAEKNGVNLHDSAILIDPAGNLLLKHQKMNILTELMNPPYTPGGQVASVDTELGRIGLLICADTFRTDVLDAMAEQKPDLVLVPYGWAAPEENWPEHGKELHSVVQSAARRIGVPVIGVDLVGQITRGPWRDRVYGGQSIMIDASGCVLAVAVDRDRDIVVADVPIKD
ncbi:MAG: carbon-nitrogen hydrolase family protein [Sedimentisphaerales bacterium]|nr:carbon-nitrogen hydrolase family protein [Sedimentisphaerales bacterium]